MPAVPRSSLVGLPAPGLGESGGFMADIGAGRLEGPMEDLAFALEVPPGGAGEGLGLVDGGRREAMEKTKIY